MPTPSHTDLVLQLVDHLQSASNRFAALCALRHKEDPYFDAAFPQEDFEKDLESLIQRAVVLRSRVLQADKDEPEDFSDLVSPRSS